MTRIAMWLGCVLLSAPASAQVARVSVSTAGTQANGPSDSPGINGDGRFVVFASAADNLVAGDTNILPDIFLRDRDVDADGVFDEAGAAATTRLNLGPGGVQANNASSDPVITPDARFVCFVSKATNLVAGVTPIAEVLQVYRLDRTTGAIVLVSASDAGTPGDLHSSDPVVSDDGNVVAFTSVAGNLVPGAQTTTRGVFMREIGTGHTTRLSPPGPSSTVDYSRPTIAADGRRVMYWSAVVGRPVFTVHVFDRQPGTVRELLLQIPFTPILAADGVHAAVFAGENARRLSVDLGPESADVLNPPNEQPVAVSFDARYILTAPAGVFDVDLGVSRPVDLQPMTSAAFDRSARWLTVASASSALPGGADTNGVEDIFVVDVRDLLDADDDGLGDAWEQAFGQSDPTTDPDADGLTTLQEHAAGSHPNGVVRRFLAEGATGSFFATDIALANPDAAQDVGVVLTFDTGDGRRLRRAVFLPRSSSRVVHAGAVPGLGAADFSTMVESDRPVAVSRTMTWDTLPGYVAPRGYGAHLETAVTGPSPTWFFAEGSTVLNFDLFYLLQNPQPAVTHATVRFLLPSGTVVTRTYDLPPLSRTTVYVNAIAGLDETDVSGEVTADAPIVAERAMYRSLPGQPFVLGHASAGVTAAAPRWFLAEGATGHFFDLYVLIANPNPVPADVEVQYAKPFGIPITRLHTVAANSRFSIFVDAVPNLEGQAVATTVTSTNGVPVVVERAMYWPGSFFDYYEGHSSAGTTTTARRWVVAGGERGGFNNAQTFILIANTSGVAGTATVTVLPGAGSPPGPPIGPTEVTLSPNSRTTVEVTQAFGAFGVLVESTGSTPVDLVVESAVYRSVGEVFWSAGGNAVATPLP